MPKNTHEVLNQAPALVNYNLYSSNPPLVEAVAREGGKWAEQGLKKFGERVGSEEVIRWGFEANENPPVLHTHDRFGNRIDEVWFHPSFHELMRLSIQHGLHNSPWSEPKKGAHVARAAHMMLASENEFGHLCPISMTYSVVPALRKQPDLAKIWEPKIFSKNYDPHFIPRDHKTGVTLGMGMTEKQGGSDVRANTTRAIPISQPGPCREYLVTGHKWFCSAPMSDGFLILAQAGKGLSCFLLPRWTPDGTRNKFFIQRLKDKLGNRSNASSEVEFEESWAQLVGEEGRGVATIIEMVNHTRLDCVLGSASLMRQALVQALHHARYRKAFGKKLAEQDLMKNVLADLALESEAATVLALRLARAYDSTDPTENALRRIGTAVAKFWVCKRAPSMIFEALECLGGNGFVEESILPRLYRESPLNSIWEGSGNVICLDVLRAAQKEPETLQALLAEINLAKGSHPSLDQCLHQLRGDFSLLGDSEIRARRLVEKLALAWQASLLLQHSPQEVAEAFCASRLEKDWGNCFGTLPVRVDFRKILERAFIP